MNPINQTYDINHRDKLYHTMGGNIPVKTKQKVLKFWLSGVARKKIAEKVGIGEGTVSSIVQDAKENIPDVDLLHEIANKITRNNWDINIFSSAIRHRKILYEKGITDDQIDSLIENVDEHCFKKQIRIEEFVNLVQEVVEFLLYYGCKIDTLPRLLGKKRAELVVLQQTIEDLRSSEIKLLRVNEVTQQDISDYSRDKPLVETIKALKEENEDQWREEMFYRTQVSILEDNWGTGEIPENMTREEVEEAAQLLLRNAVDLVKVIKYIQKKAPLLPHRAGLRIMERYDNDNNTDKGKR